MSLLLARVFDTILKSKPHLCYFIFQIGDLEKLRFKFAHMEMI